MRRVFQFFVLMFLASTFSGALAQAGTIVLHNTGVTTTGTLLSTGASDPNYTLTVNPASGGTSTAYVATTPNAAWIKNSSISQWINPLATGSSAPPVVVNGEYDYVTSFSLAGFDPTTASISGQLAADDTVSDILINGHSTHATNNAAYGYGSYKAFSIDSLYSADFLSGVNTITFKVQNTGNGPSALQVQMTGTASTIAPEPSAIVPFVMGAMGLLTMIAYRRRLMN